MLYLQLYLQIILNSVLAAEWSSFGIELFSR